MLLKFWIALPAIFLLYLVYNLLVAAPLASSGPEFEGEAIGKKIG